MFRHHSSGSRFLVVLCVLLCAVASAKAQDKVLLRLNLRPGQTFDQGVSIEMKTSQTIQKKRMDMTMNVRFELHNAVLNVGDDGTITLQTTYQSIIATHRLSVNEKAYPAIHYDSTKPSQTIPPADQTLAALAGESLVATISPRGEILNITGMDEIIQRIIANEKSPASRAELQKILKASFDSQGKQALKFAIFPESAVAVGDSWKTQNTQFAEVPLLVSAQYSLNSSQNGLATLAVQSTINTNADSPSIKMQGKAVSSSLSGTQTGVIHVDEQSGWTRDAQLHQRISGRITMKDLPVTPHKKSAKTASVSWPIYIKSTIRSWTLTPISY